MNASDFGTIIQIGDILVSEEVATEYFCCDYARCKGRCCIEGDGGAPLLEEELERLEECYPAFSPLMQERGRVSAEANGFFEVDRDGDLVTPLVAGEFSNPYTGDRPAAVPPCSAGSRECAYAFFEEDGSCLCAIERCFESGGCSFRKPISCSLYPIRVTNLTGGGKALNLHRWGICADAFEKGRREGIRVYEFLREPLCRAYGEDFYAQLCAAAEYINGK